MESRLSLNVLQPLALLMYYCWRSSAWHGGGRPGVWTSFYALGESFKLSLHLLHPKATVFPPLWDGFFMVLKQKASVAWFS